MDYIAKTPASVLSMCLVVIYSFCLHLTLQLKTELNAACLGNILSTSTDCWVRIQRFITISLPPRKQAHRVAAILEYQHSPNSSREHRQRYPKLMELHANNQWKWTQKFPSPYKSQQGMKAKCFYGSPWIAVKIFRINNKSLLNVWLGLNQLMAPWRLDIEKLCFKTQNWSLSASLPLQKCLISS